MPTLGSIVALMKTGRCACGWVVYEKAHIFVGSKGDYYELPDDGLPRYEEYR
jgi:hypothetical protein